MYSFSLTDENLHAIFDWQYQTAAKNHHVQAESLPKSSFLQQIRSTVYFMRDGSVRIGTHNVNGLRLDILSMPDHIDTNFSATRTEPVIL